MKKNLKIYIKIFKNFKEKNLKLQSFYNASKTHAHVMRKIKNRLFFLIRK